ncbi:MAG: selenocysteine-specific translation elongation factor [Candidatus Thorarchaeota archaeon]|nr:selenocysteine-specific translation elongation factor [Candidatus Thorarchaeota archaeon]
MKEPTPVHVGLMGHIDHGKTALASVLSEGVFTAGLDKHPQSKARGITIDLGFTMFQLEGFLVTLVDAPGHADLIRSVVAGANIIDAAILTVAADEGPKVQTGEHIIVLEAMGIDTVVVAITKIDLVDETQLRKVEAQIEKIIGEINFKRTEVVRVSAKTREGIDNLREALLRVLTPRPRNIDGTFLMPIDHAFHVRGHGTVTTGTILRGHVQVGDTVQLMPHKTLARVRSIQTFGNEREKAQAGDRVGINVPDIDPKMISRGDYLCEQDSLTTASILIVRIKRNPLYKRPLTKAMILSAHIGMSAVICEAYPFEQVNGHRVLIPHTEADDYELVLHCQRPIASEIGTKVLLLRTDLGPTEMRIIGHGEILELSESLVVYRRKRRTGVVTRVRENDVLVEGLASHKEMAQQMKGVQVSTEQGDLGVVQAAFGTKGVVAVSFKGPVAEGTMVYYDRFVEERM